MKLGFDVNENHRDRKSNSSLKIKEELLKTSKNRTGFFESRLIEITLSQVWF